MTPLSRDEAYFSSCQTPLPYKKNVLSFCCYKKAKNTLRKITTNPSELKENKPFNDYFKLVKKQNKPNGPLWLNKKKSFLANANDMSPVLKFD